MANSKIKTLWTLSGRVVDSREVLDSNGGLCRGRVDVPESMTVVVEGYSKVEFRSILSDGSVEAHPDFTSWIAGMGGVVESKVGSGVMTVFVEMPQDSLGLFQLDVYKEWEEGGDPEPEPEPSGDAFVSAGKRSYGSVFGISLMSADNSVTNLMFDGNDVNRTLSNAYGFRTLSEKVEALESINTVMTARISKLELNDKTTQDTLRALDARIKALENPTV
ncbi:hypothetical protein YpEc11_43 [Yersinia phage vB_YpEc11]|uniref:Uncharacterized protein n=1 Tax=Yersinia phage vB_YpEc11 TaxID=3056113 RepID=A0AA51VHD4_9CAUD|nr:hypothetical protein YpEc11_43 [Yersinia phage vB_YpEc11]